MKKGRMLRKAVSWLVKVECSKNVRMTTENTNDDNGEDKTENTDNSLFSQVSLC